jgi:hypothetical protein
VECNVCAVGWQVMHYAAQSVGDGWCARISHPEPKRLSVEGRAVRLTHLDRCSACVSRASWFGPSSSWTKSRASSPAGHPCRRPPPTDEMLPSPSRKDRPQAGSLAWASRYQDPNGYGAAASRLAPTTPRANPLARLKQRRAVPICEMRLGVASGLIGSLELLDDRSERSPGPSQSGRRGQRRSSCYPARPRGTRERSGPVPRT